MMRRPIPYLAIASLLGAAFLGIRDALTPPDPLQGYGYNADKADKLPGSRDAALDALEADNYATASPGAPFVETFLTYKRDEFSRFQHFVTDWEFQEYGYHM